MARLHVVTCGTSIWDNLVDFDLNGFGVGDLAAQGAAALAGIVEPWSRPNSEVPGLRGNPPDGLSAELSTLSGTDSTDPWRVRPGDDVLIFAADTDEGVGAALLVALRLRAVELPGAVVRIETSDAGRNADEAPAGSQSTVTVARIPQLDLGSEAGTSSAKSSVTVARIPQLDPGRRDAFGAAIGLLGVALHRHAERQDGDDEVVVHLSGGYKATIPFLLLLAEIVATVVRAHVTAVIRYEGGEAIPVPIREVRWNELCRALDDDNVDDPVFRSLTGNLDVAAAVRRMRDHLPDQAGVQ